MEVTGTTTVDADFRCEGVQLVHHRVDGVLRLENLAPHVDGDLSRQVARGDGGLARDKGFTGIVADRGQAVAKSTAPRLALR